MSDPERIRSRGPFFAIFAIVAILLLFAGLLVWQVQHKVAELASTEAALANSNALGATRLIERFIAESRRRVALFARENADEIAQLAGNPQDEALAASLRERVERHFPNFFAFTVADRHGRVLLDDFDGHVGEICRLDIDVFARQGHPLDVQIHPNPAGYHFDILGRWSVEDGGQGLFFVSFSPDWPARILRNSQLPGHALLLMHRGFPYRIEISAEGSRLDMTRPVELDDAEYARIGVRIPVEGSQWVTVDLPPTGWLRDQEQRLWSQALGVFLVFFALAGLAIWLVWRFDRKRKAAEWRLQNANADLEFRVQQRTLELSESNLQLQAQHDKLEALRRDLQTSEGSFRQLLEGLPNAIIVTDADGNIVHANHQSAEMFGYPEKELLGCSVEDLIPESAREQHRWQRAAYVEAPQVRRMGGTGLELFACRRDGSRFPVDVGLNALQTPEGLRYVAAIADESERSRAERETAVVRDWLQAVINAMPFLLLGVDGRGRATLWNRRAGQCFADAEPNSRGRLFDQLLPWLEPLHDRIIAAIGACQPLGPERLSFDEQGENRVVELALYPLHDGELPGAVIRIDDVARSQDRG